MKYIYMGILCFIIVSCNPQKRLFDNSSHMIEKLHQITDTVYVCDVAFVDSQLIWYHDSTMLYGFIVRPYSTKKIQPINCINPLIEANSFDEYFKTGFENNDPCFQLTLDGVSVSMYVKNKKRQWCSVDTDCLFSKEYPKNSFPYLLKQDISLLNKTMRH